MYLVSLIIEAEKAGRITTMICNDIFVLDHGSRNGRKLTWIRSGTTEIPLPMAMLSPAFRSDLA